MSTVPNIRSAELKIQEQVSLPNKASEVPALRQSTRNMGAAISELKDSIAMMNSSTIGLVLRERPKIAGTRDKAQADIQRAIKNIEQAMRRFGK